MTVDEGLGAEGDPATGKTATVTPDPAAEVVCLAAKLLRLQSRLGADRTGIDAARAGAEARSCAPMVRGSARHAAVRSGVEVLQGLAVSLIGEIQISIERDAFYYLYQPIASVATGAIEGYEALMRWRRGEEAVLPALFLPIAEETRLLHRIQQGLLDDVAAVLANLGPAATIGFNWSPAQLTDAAAVTAMIERVTQLGIDPARLIVEITERSAMFDPGRAHAGVLRLKQAGFRVALDDFGSGYCNFSYLSRLPIDLIKIDGSLINEIQYSERAGTIIEGIIAVAHRLGHRVVAEGVETAQQLAALAAMGCDLAQGHAIGYPVREPAQPSAPPARAP